MDPRCRAALEIAEKNFPQSLILRCSKARDHGGMHLFAEPVDWTYRFIDGSGVRLVGPGEVGWCEETDEVWFKESLSVTKMKFEEKQMLYPNFIALRRLPRGY
jgi:hypothetical protein